MKSVLITGGTGSLGNALAERLLQLEVPRICIFSRSEKDQAAMRRKFPQVTRFFIGDVRDRKRLHRAMEGCDTVIHAAALKRIEVGVYNPMEMVNTNVYGSANAVEAARDAGVGKTILVSTDKAVSPVSTYGETKALAEQIFDAANTHYGTSGSLYSKVRYGNVWGSNGSVVPIWRDIIRSGANPEITDPDCTRFFITLPRAVDFILGAIDKMKGGETFVPDLPAYRLGDVARALVPAIENSCNYALQDHGFVITGLPKHEKKHEVMELDGPTSEEARRMSVEELRSYL